MTMISHHDVTTVRRPPLCIPPGSLACWSWSNPRAGPFSCSAQRCTSRRRVVGRASSRVEGSTDPVDGNPFVDAASWVDDYHHVYRTRGYIRTVCTSPIRAMHVCPWLKVATHPRCRKRPNLETSSRASLPHLQLPLSSVVSFR